MRFLKLIILLFVVFSMVACEKPAPPLTKEEIQKFIDDSKYILSLLENARMDGFRELTFDEEREFLAYEVNYGSETDFQTAADNPTVSLIVSEISLMKLELGNTGTVVGNYNPKESYLMSKESLNEYMLELKNYLKDYGTKGEN
ncbi:hypothetical protein M3172_08655 [Mesobacillus subterraneus]|uniref:hypothetical protein n=1 Tax=Mesobacillus subterraneus TaxID=285983 RepID=UPI002040E9FE|nr:hypothetical protein [Mesobacillus subterraneus]MCM3573263.1 hypothetical protein [Mesobacillus subterraneus]